MSIVLHDEIPVLNDIACEPAGACTDRRAARMFAEAEHIDIFAEDRARRGASASAFKMSAAPGGRSLPT